MGLDHPATVKHGQRVWIGVDFDGTLAHRNSGDSWAVIGSPIPRMVERVRGWLAQGYRVKIVTARAWVPHCSCMRDEAYMLRMSAIQEWCREHLGQVLEVTCEKDPGMLELWDDRAISVEYNTGNYVSADSYRAD